MKKIILLFIPFITLCCSNENSATPQIVEQNISVLVKPIETDKNYLPTDQSHYVVRNTKTHFNKLLLFIGGSFSVPKDYNLVCDHAASIGYDVISISYPNNVGTAPLGASNDSLIFDNYRDELCFGNQVSNVVSVDVLNAISTRVTKLLLFLKATYPDQNWGQYLSSSNIILWNNIAVAGHSQGSGHACFIAKKYLVDRVVMFSGPNDFSTYYKSAANWLIKTGKTPLVKHFSLLHTRDEIVPFINQVANLRGLGLLTATQNPTLADNLTAPYLNSQSLSLNIPALSNHNSPIGANSILPGIWTYLLTSN